jgi:hypothetical protein
MVCFQIKNTNLGKFWTVLRWKMLVYFVAIRSIFRSSGIFYGFWAYFKVIWYIYIPRFGQLSQEKSGNHDDGHLLLLLEVLRVHEVRRRRSHAGRIQLKRKRTWHWGPGTDVMITIFCDFLNFCEKFGVFLKNQCYDQLFA